MHHLVGTSINLLRDQIAGLGGARSLAYPLDRSRLLHSDRLALGPLATVFRGALVLVLLAATSYFGEAAYARSASDMLGLPPYCAGRFARDTNPMEYKRWEGRYGPDFLHTHHLCDAIIAINKIHRVKNAMERNTLMKDAMGNLNYMIQHAKPDFGLMPDVYLYRSRVHNLLDRRGEAVADLRKAIELNPKASASYLLAVGYLENIGQKEDALKLVTEGLRHLPDNQSLRKAYLKLGGKEPFPEPLQASEQRGQTPTQPQSEQSTEPKLAVFDLSRILGGGGNVWREAGAHFFVELSEYAKDPTGKVQIRLLSMVPQPATRVARIGIDMGRHQNLFSDIQVQDSVFGKYYPLKRADGSFSHAFWQGFRATYLATFTIDAKEAKMYDPKALPSGNSLTMVASLAPGARFEDVFEAMREGLRAPSGLRLAIIAHHTRGYRPDPRQTIMDDGGFVTGNLRRLTGLKQPESETSVTKAEPRPEFTPATESRSGAPATAGVDATPAARGPASSESQPEPGKAPSKNPWCRFCPAE